MRVAVFSDIHGNLTALRAVLAAIRRHGAMDAIVAAGDLIGGGPSATEIVDELRDSQVQAVFGNMDEAVVRFEEARPQFFPGGFLAWVEMVRDFTLPRLTPEAAEWIRSLPITLRISPAPGHDLMVCHNNPATAWEPTTGAQVPTEALRRHYAVEGVAAVAYGHIHRPHVKSVDGRLLVNVASVSKPADGIPTAGYSLFTWADGCWMVQQFRVPYDLGEEVELIRKADPAPELAARLMPVTP